MTENIDPTPLTDREQKEKPSFYKARFVHPGWILLIAFIAAILLEKLTHAPAKGLASPLASLLLAVVIAGTALLDGKKLPLASLLLMVVSVLISGLLIFRLEAYTRAALILSTLAGFFLLAISALNGQAWFYELRDYIKGGLTLALSGLVGLPLSIGSLAQSDSPADSPKAKRGALSVLIGLLIAGPFLLIFGLLLSMADSKFSAAISELFAWFRPDNFGEKLLSFILIAGFTWIVTGLLHHVLLKTGTQKKEVDERPWIKPFLGLTESSVVLGSVIILFASFLIIQSKRLFVVSFDLAEVSRYSERAVRGFYELIVVGGLAGLLFFALASFTRRETKGQKLSFSILSTILFAEVGAILFSAFKRLSLYEQAYGFTRDRLVAFIFMLFLGLLLLTMLVLEWTKELKRVALVTLLICLAFSLTLTAVNIDASIATRNVERAIKGQDLDLAYLAQKLSDDAVPTLLAYYQRNELPKELHDKLGQVLSCRIGSVTDQAENQSKWLAWNLSKSRAGKLLAPYAEELRRAYPLKTLDDSSTPVFESKEGYISCNRQFMP